MIIIKKNIPEPLRSLLKRSFDFITWDPWVRRSWSQEGEDLVLQRIFEQKKIGFYVDVGAHHPKRFSNTYLFYRRGWSGINIDAMPGSMSLFKKMRPRDVNLEMGVAEANDSLDYYVFNESALNGFSKELSQERSKGNNPYYVKDVIKVKVFPLAQILDDYHQGQEIDFLSVDVEGLDLQVLRSNNWEKYRPKYVLAELLQSSLYNLWNHEVSLFMKKNYYDIYAKQVNTVIFRDQRIAN